MTAERSRSRSRRHRRRPGRSRSRSRSPSRSRSRRHREDRDRRRPRRHSTSSRSRSRSASRDRDRDRGHRDRPRRSRRSPSPSRSQSSSRRRRSRGGASRRRDRRGRRRGSRDDADEGDAVVQAEAITGPTSPSSPSTATATTTTATTTLTTVVATTVVVGGDTTASIEDSTVNAEALVEVSSSSQIAAETDGDVSMADEEEPAPTAMDVTKPMIDAGQELLAPVPAPQQIQVPVGPLTTARPLPASTPAPAVDVNSIKLNILKALAEARSTIAVIKKDTNASGASSVENAPPPPVVTRKQPETSTTTPMGVTVGAVTSPTQTLKPTANPQDEEIGQKQPPPKAVEVDDEFDMFSAAELHDAAAPQSPVPHIAAAIVETSMLSNCDDPEGYYRPQIGEVLHASYRVLGTVGKGVFSTVLRCQRIVPTDDDQPDIVAIKLIRNNEVMREAAQVEVRILSDLAERDPRDKKHCVRLLDRFEHRNHVALVFEPMQMNLREAMKKFGGKSGISIQAVRIFCKHLLIALSHLEGCGVVHADIKPDNILLDDKQTMIKLCDFGSAFKLNEGKHDPTPYLVSRFYRAPEIVLGLPYDKAVDMWSVGCCLFEMFTGKVMFPGGTNNEMLKLFMELKGKVPNKIIKKHRQAYIDQFQMEPHFTEDNKFCSRELDRVTGKPVLRLLDSMKTKTDLGSTLMSSKSSTDDRKQVLELRNLLERMFTLDPSKRITPKDALAHPFVKFEGKHGL